ncbi:MULTISPECIES: aspartyl protease family protein [unclassified Carboxylicivirga]|uniref:aspartyl protease family protein n=1 Tax=Carboxylicivirga TaxID=1628153 RepID=UPI003D33CE3D
MYRCKIMILVLMLLPGSRVLAQFNGGRMVSDAFYTEIPFDYVHDAIVVEAAINGVKGRYLLDTGAMCILFKDSVVHDFPNARELRIGDATGKKQMASVVDMPLIEIGGLRYEGIPTLYIDVFKGPFKCLGYKGIIGSNLLRFGAFKVDWAAHKLIIAKDYQTLGMHASAGSKMRVNKQQSSPFVKVKVNGKDIKWVLLDTGSGDSFSLYHITANWLRKKGVLAAPVYQSNGTNSHGAWGAGSYAADIYNLESMTVGRQQFYGPIIETGAGKSKIGMQVLERGDFVMDYPQKRFFIAANKECVDLLIRSFGLDFIMYNDTFVVNGVWQDTAADSAGIQKGDVLVDIKGFNFANQAPCDIYRSLKHTTRSKERLTFVFRRDDMEREVSLSRIKF